MRPERLLLGEMIRAAERACDLVEGIGLEDLERDRMRQEALLWNCTVLGEAAAQVEVAVRARFPEIAWTRPVSLRNRIVHGYWSVDLAIVHTTATDLLRPFIIQLRAALETLEADPE